MISDKSNHDAGKNFAGFLGKQGFYLLMIACVGIIAATAIVGSLTNKKKESAIKSSPTQAATATIKPVSNNNPIIADDPLKPDTVNQVVLTQPLDGDVIRPFAMDTLVYSSTLKDWQTHSGIDIKGTEGASVVAALNGKVESVAQDALMGNVVTIKDDDNSYTVYASLKSVAVKKDDIVKAGQTIGAVGTTAASEISDGPHLHFEYKVGNSYMDPEQYFGTK